MTFCLIIIFIDYLKYQFISLLIIWLRVFFEKITINGKKITSRINEWYYELANRPGTKEAIKGVP